MTKPYSYQKWQTARVWPGGGWGEALAQVRKDQRLTQHDVADFVGVRLATLRRWEDGKRFLIAHSGQSLRRRWACRFRTREFRTIRQQSEN